MITLLAAIAALSAMGSAASTYYTRLFYLRVKELANLASDHADRAKMEVSKASAHAGAAQADAKMANDVMNYTLSTAANHKNTAERLETSAKMAAEKALDHAETAMKFAQSTGIKAGLLYMVSKDAVYSTNGCNIGGL